jgi:triacylglycerol lipase
MMITGGKITGMPTPVRRAVLSLIALAALIAVMPAAAAKAAPPYPEAVLLVSGFETESPYSTPAAECVGQEGSEWNPPGFPAESTPEGLAPVLKQAGNRVFTAPVTKSTTPLPATCSGPGEPLPDFDTMTITSNGDTNANGAALARLIAFLQDEYGVEELRLVGHSDGGLWSRAALTQNEAYLGLEIPSFTTLGTPHTGSYLADLAMELKGGKCDFSNKIEQRICDALVVAANLIVLKLGPTATFQLSNDYLATWNPQQSIGNCPVSAIAGDHIDLRIPFLEYYAPSDGLVGIASAQAKAAIDINGHPIPAPSIPDLREAGVYDVVHGGSLGFIYGKNLLNQAQISQTVSQSILLSGSSPCNVTPIPTASASDSGATASNGRVSDDSSDQQLRAPLYRMVAADRKGRLPKPGPEDFAVSRKGVSVRCGFERLAPIPLLGERQLRIHTAAGCGKRLKARKNEGKGAARALLLRSNRSRHVIVRTSGERVRIRVRGNRPKTLKAHYLDQGKWKRLKLNRRGWSNLPETERSSFRLRVRAKGTSADTPADTANLTLAR